MNLGAQKLRAAISHYGAQKRLADTLGVSPAVVHRWAHKGSGVVPGTRPTTRHRVALSVRLGIDLMDWDAPEDPDFDPATVDPFVGDAA